MSYIGIDGQEIDQASLLPDVARRLEIERRHQDSIVFFHDEDFYAVYGDPAKVVASRFGLSMNSISVTRSGQTIYECTVPEHLISRFSAELGLMGYPTALCQTMTVGGKHHNYVRSWFVTD